MSFIETIRENTTDPEVAEMYEKLTEALGYLPNYGRQFSHRPAVFNAWVQLNNAIKSTMDPRRYELATVAAAVKRRSSYCALAHSEKQLELGSTPDQVVALVSDPTSAGLSEQEQAIVEYAAIVAGDPASVDESDIERLRRVGLSDAEIFDVAAASAARCFFASLSDALGTLPDAGFRERMPGLVDTLAVGRSLAE
ncbi:MAG TPA: peroxidase-related enzyme [Acidimicrobiia bacterium]|nr:peroxidase-related enzyme [Acidimicrobiia bacterium]